MNNRHRQDRIERRGGVKASITEIFSSIQGEGVFVGKPQIFIRFANCNLNCNFCDTPKKGGKDYSAFELLDLINNLNSKDVIDTISITGGEPLEQTDFLASFLPYLKVRNFKIYLETNGTLPSELERILDLVDIVAMDIKLPSSQGGKSFWARHGDFLKVANKKYAFVKIVITPKTSEGEIRKATAVIGGIDRRIPLVLQPVTPANKVRKKVSAKELFEFQRLARTFLDDVRIVPQIHKAIGVR